MDNAKLRAIAEELARDLKTSQDLNEFSAFLKKMMIEAALGAELSEHLGYDKHQPKKSANTRNGYSRKTLSSPDGNLDVALPRDRKGTFEPILIKKHQTRITSMDDQILSLYAKGMTNREIVDFFSKKCTTLTFRPRSSVK